MSIPITCKGLGLRVDGVTLAAAPDVAQKTMILQLRRQNELGDSVVSAHVDNLHAVPNCRVIHGEKNEQNEETQVGDDHRCHHAIH